MKIVMTLYIVITTKQMIMHNAKKLFSQKLLFKVSSALEWTWDFVHLLKVDKGCCIT